MTIQKLNGSAEYLINQLDLKPQEEEVIRTCVRRYTILDSDSTQDVLTIVFYRLINTFKSIFGQSDWQIAKKIIEVRAMKHFEEVEKKDIIHKIHTIFPTQIIKEKHFIENLRKNVNLWAEISLECASRYYKVYKEDNQELNAFTKELKEDNQELNDFTKELYAFTKELCNVKIVMPRLIEEELTTFIKQQQANRLC